MRHYLRTVSQFASGTRFTEAQLRWWIFSCKNNGLYDAGGVLRIGRRVYIDEAGFDRWVSEQNQEAA